MEYTLTACPICWDPLKMSVAQVLGRGPMFDRIKRNRYRKEAGALAVLLCPDERKAAGGQRLTEVAADGLIALHGALIDEGFAAGKTSEQSALAVVGALIGNAVTDVDAGEKQHIRSAFLCHAGFAAHPISEWVRFVLFTTGQWEGASKISRADIDGFMASSMGGIFLPTPAQDGADNSDPKPEEALFREIQSHLQRRFSEVSQNLLQVFRDRLKTTHDQPIVGPKAIAQIEYDIFVKEMKDYPSRLTHDLHGSLRRLREVAQEGGSRDTVDQYIQKQIVEACAMLHSDAALAFSEVVQSLESDSK